MRSGFLFSAVLIIALIIVPVSGAEIHRTVVKENDNTSLVRLTITAGPVIGITETLADGSVVTSCSLPSGQYRVSPGNLHLAVIGEKEITYTLQGGGIDPVSGTWTDLSDGSEGTVLGEGQSLPSPTQSATPAAPATTRAPGAGFIPAFGALCLGGAAVLFWGHRP